jgi:hypothetical protein
VRAESAELRNAAYNYGPVHDDATWVRLHNAAIDYVSMLLTGDAADGTHFDGDRKKWLEFVRANPNAFAGMLEDLKYLKRG